MPRVCIALLPCLGVGGMPTAKPASLARPRRVIASLAVGLCGNKPSLSLSPGLSAQPGGVNEKCLGSAWQSILGGESMFIANRKGT